MTEKLSALVDGELDSASAASLIRSASADEKKRVDWDCYHLIGDALRNEVPVDPARQSACMSAIFARLAAEPTVLAPAAARKPAPVHHRTRMVLAMAASVATVSAIGVVAFKQQQGASIGPAAVAQASSVRSPAAVEKRVNDYLVVHRQYANPNALQAASLQRNTNKQVAGQ